MEKLVKGLTWRQVGRYLEETHVIDLRFCSLPDAKLLTDLLDRRGATVDRGPGIRARVARDAKNPLCAGYEFTIWDTLTVYALVLPRDS